MLKKSWLIRIIYLISSFVVFSSLIACNSFGYKPVFYNYEDYLSKYSQNGIQNEFNYRQFSDLTEFKKYIIENKTIGGVGSDYMAAKLSRLGKIQKIDYQKIFGKKIDSKNISNFFTPQTIKIMESFELGDLDQDGKTDHLYEYMVPYFSQYKLIAFNIERISGFSKEDYQLTNQELQNKYFKKLTYYEILQTLKSLGATSMQISDYYRANIAIGSELENQDGSFFTTKIDNIETSQKYINNFKKTINDFTSISNPQKIKFNSNATSILNDLINVNKKWEVGIIHNGDALDAYFGNDNEVGAKDGLIRVIKPKNTIFLIDGLFLHSKANAKMQTKFYKVLYQYFFKDIMKKESEIIDYLNLENQNNKNSFPYYNNFNFLNFNVPYLTMNNVLEKTYFASNDQNPLFIYKMPKSNFITKNQIFQPVDEKINANVLIQYQAMKTNGN